MTGERLYLTIAEVMAIHRHQIDEYGGIHGLRDEGALESAVFRPQTGYYNDLAEEAAALLESLVNNHAFLDGNKRVGFAAMHTFLLINGFGLDLSGDEVAEFMLQNLAEGKFRFALLYEWISRHLVAAGP